MHVVQYASSTWLLAVFALVPPLHAQVDRLVVGEPAEVTLAAADEKGGAPGAPHMLSFVADSDGPITVTAESFVGDVVLRILGPDGATPVEVDDGLPMSNVRHVLTCKAGETVRMAVTFRAGGPGAVIVKLALGDVPAPEGNDRYRYIADSWRGHARSALTADATGRAKAIEAWTQAGRLYFGLGLYAASREAFEALAPLAKQNGDARSEQRARGYLACIEAKSGDGAKAVELLGAAAAEEEAAASSTTQRDDFDIELEVVVNSNLGAGLMSCGRLIEARRALERALTLLRQGQQHSSNEAVIRGQLIRLTLQQHDLVKARELCDEALKLAEASGNKESLADALQRRAGVLRDMGDNPGAKADVERALELVASPATRCQALGILGQVETSLEEFELALAHLDEACEIADSHHDEALMGAALVARAQFWRALGQHESARDDLIEALRVLPTGGRGGNRVAALLLLGAVASELGDESSAGDRFEEARKLAQQGGDASVQVAALEGLAMHLEATGDLAHALQYAIEGTDLARTTGQVTLLGDLLDLKAYVLLKQGKPAEARPIASESLAILKPLQEPARLLPPLTTLAEIALAQRDTRLAEDHLAEAEKIVDRPDIVLEPELASGRRSLAPAAAVGELSQDLVAQHLRAAKTAAEKWTILEDGLAVAGRWKGRGLFEGLTLRSSANHDALGELSVGGTGRLQSAAAVAAKGTVDRVCEALGKDRVLVEYVEGMDRLYAYVLHDDTGEFLDLGPRSSLQALVDGYVSDISEPPGLAKTPVTPARIAEDGHALYAAVLGPALKGRASGKHLVIVPSPTVATLPFEALVTATTKAPRGYGDIEYLLDSCEVSYAPSVPVLELLAAAGPRSTPGRALVLGDPAFPEPGAKDSPRGTRHPWLVALARLPGTREEAQGIADRLTELRGDGFVDLRMDEQADAMALKGAAGAYSLLHCATHGLIDLQDTRRIGLAFAPGANDDGFVSLADVLGLQLDADLAVLSACETARGRERRGEGTQSLARAFLYAGARSVVSTLWPVDDLETEKLMLDFYDGFTQGGLALSPALHGAQLKLRHAARTEGSFRGVGRKRGGRLSEPPVDPSRDLSGHPYFWAAFVYVGSPTLHPLAAAVPSKAAPPAKR